MDSIIKRMGAKGASGSTAAEGATICAEGADEGVSVGISSIVTIGAKGAGGSAAAEGATAVGTTNKGATDMTTLVTTAG